jgi:hypothetical protein
MILLRGGADALLMVRGLSVGWKLGLAGIVRVGFVTSRPIAPVLVLSLSSEPVQLVANAALSAGRRDRARQSRFSTAPSKLRRTKTRDCTEGDERKEYLQLASRVSLSNS